MNPKFNMKDAGDLIGKHVMIDLIIHDYDEAFVEQKQMYGTIVRVSESEGVVVKLTSSGHEYILPPDVDEFTVLPPGTMVSGPAGEIPAHAELATSILVHLPPPEYEGPIRNEADPDPTGKSGPYHVLGEETPEP